MNISTMCLVEEVDYTNMNYKFPTKCKLLSRRYSHMVQAHGASDALCAGVVNTSIYMHIHVFKCICRVYGWLYIYI